MKAFLLTAGTATRLRPLTDSIPKCLLPVNGVPLLEIWVETFNKYGISEVMMNYHHLPEQVERYFDGSTIGKSVRKVYESKLLGTAGTVFSLRKFVENEKYFFIVYGDNLTNMDLSRMLDFHKRSKSIFTMGLFRSTRPKECGIVELDKENGVISFTEKPDNPASNLANAGIYIAGHELFDLIRYDSGRMMDFGYHVLPRLAGKMTGYIIEEYFIDIGTKENYERANREWGTLGEI